MRVMGYELTDRQVLNFDNQRTRLREGGTEARSERAGQVRGFNYTFWPDTIRALKRDHRVDEALDLLLECVAAAERDGTFWQGQIAPWYTEAAAIIYRRRKDYSAELAVLRRYENAVTGKCRRTFTARIAKAQALATKAHSNTSVPGM